MTYYLNNNNFYYNNIFFGIKENDKWPDHFLVSSIMRKTAQYEFIKLI